MEITRRGLFGLIGAALTALGFRFASSNEGEKQEVAQQTYRCFNCLEIKERSKWIPDGALIRDDEWRLDPANDSGVWSIGSTEGSHAMARVHLCDDCIKSIANCATCERLLKDLEGKMRLSRASEPIAPLAWPGFPQLVGKFVKVGRRIPAAEPTYILSENGNSDPRFGYHVLVRTDEFKARYGVRPVNRDLIVADCRACTSLRNLIETIRSLPSSQDRAVYRRA